MRSTGLALFIRLLRAVDHVLRGLGAHAIAAGNIVRRVSRQQLLIELHRTLCRRYLSEAIIPRVVMPSGTLQQVLIDAADDAVLAGSVQLGLQNADLVIRLLPVYDFRSPNVFQVLPYLSLQARLVPRRPIALVRLDRCDAFAEVAAPCQEHPHIHIRLELLRDRLLDGLEHALNGMQHVLDGFYFNALPSPKLFGIASFLYPRLFSRVAVFRAVEHAENGIIADGRQMVSMLAGKAGCVFNEIGIDERDDFLTLAHCCPIRSSSASTFSCSAVLSRISAIEASIRAASCSNSLRCTRSVFKRSRAS